MRHTTSLRILITLALAGAGCAELLGIEEPFVDESGRSDLVVESVSREPETFSVRYCNVGGDFAEGEPILLDVINVVTGDFVSQSESVPEAGSCVDSAVVCADLGGPCRSRLELDVYIDAADDVDELSELNNGLRVVFGASVRAFVSSDQLTGAEVSSTFEADVRCQGLADDAGLSGLWRALLSDRVADPWARFRIGDAVPALVDGTPLGPSLEGLLDGQALARALDRDERSSSVAAGGCVWTGTEPAGPSGDDCANWSDPGGVGAAGEVGQLSSSWLFAGTTDCASSCRLYCVEQEPFPGDPDLYIASVVRGTADYQVEVCNQGDSSPAQENVYVLVYNPANGASEFGVVAEPAASRCETLLVSCATLGDADCQRGLSVVAVADPFDSLFEADEVNNTVSLELPPLSARAFVSSVPYAADELASTSGADALCQALADNAGIGGSFSAWVSDDVSAPDDRFVRQSLPYVRVDGAEIAAGYTDLTDGSLAVAIDVDETQGSQSAVCVWTGTDASGLALGDTCSSWTDATSSSLGATGFTDSASSSWSSSESFPCDSSCHIYCFEQ